MQEQCQDAFKPCKKRCGDMVHVSKKKEHRETCTHRNVTCDICHKVTVPRHQINHHKNEECFAKA